jgi:outer membrane protein TolC
MYDNSLAYRTRLPIIIALCIVALSSARICGQDQFGQNSFRPDLTGIYQGRAQLAAENEQSSSVVQALPNVPENFVPWWSDPVRQQMRGSNRPMLVTLESLVVGALMHSSQVKVFSDLPLIRRTSILEAEASFDWTGFVNTRWNDISEPVGSTLTVGPGGSRFSDHKWEYEMGLRRRVRTGGNLEVRQEFGWEDSNSSFFVPPTQGTSRIAVSFTQPLLRGSGKYYNSSLILLAEIDTAIADDELSRQLQSHLLEVVRAFWALYLERGSLLQKKRLYERAFAIFSQLEARAAIDAPRNQIARARAAVTARQADLLRAEAAIRNAEARIRALVNDPALTDVESVELVPQDQPSRMLMPISMRKSLSTALQNRPEVGQSLKQVKAASTRLDMSKKELLPILDLILEGYANGLRGDGAIGRALGDQFDTGAPSYTVGLQFEMPIGNRAAKARHQRRRIELRQVTNQFRTTAETLLLEVEVAVREVTTSYREVLAKFRSMKAAEAEVEYIQARWEQLAGDDRAGSLVLEDLLAAQQRVADAEMGYLGAEVTYNLALTNHKRAMGVLLQNENILRGEAIIDCLPEILFDKDGVAGNRIHATDNLPIESIPPTRHGVPAEALPKPGSHPGGNPRLTPTPMPNKTAAWERQPSRR